MLRLLPPGRVGLEHGLDAGLMAFDGEGAGAVGVERGKARRGRGGGRRFGGVVRLRPFLVHDVPGIPLRIENGIGRGQDEIDGEVVDLDDLGIERNAGLQVGALFANPVRGEHHIVGGEGVAVLEFHALAQMKTPAGRFRNLPAFRQPGDDLEILVTGDQPFKHLAEMCVRGALVQRIGIERFQVALVGVTQGLGRCRRHRESEDRSRDGCLGRCKQTLTYRHLFDFSTLISYFRKVLADIADPCCQSPAAAQASIAVARLRFARRCGNG